MKKTKHYFFVIALLFLSMNCSSQEKTPEDLSNDFFNLYKSKKYNEAIQNIFSTNSYLANNDFSKILSKIKQYENLLGEYQGYEKIIEKKAGQSISTSIYLVKYDRQPVRFIMTFYRANKSWKILNFKMNEKFTEEIENSTIRLSYN